MAFDPDNEAHREWLGYVQPVGLVVSAPALLAAAATVNRNIASTHREFLEWVEEVRLSSAVEPVRVVRDLPGLLHSVFQWQRADFVGAEGAAKLPETLEIPLTNYEETLRPTYAVPSVPADGGREVPPYQMLIQVLPLGTPLDELLKGERIHWEASPQARFERLLRGTGIPIGLLANGTHLRLVYAPSGESSGHATFSVSDMSEVPGRPIFAALHMLLESPRLFTLPERRRLPWILAESRRYQNTVSTKLAQQVLAALYELLRGFQSADEQRRGELLRGVLQDDPNQVYAGLLSVLMRLVFTLFAEDRDLLSKSAIYTNHYSLTGLFERLRADDGQYHETMDSRYGAWAQLLALFRVIHDGAAHGDFHLPARHGHLFDPNRHAFLEGRPLGSKREWGERIEPPLVSDGVVFRVLQNLLMLDGERLSYRTLDVEQIGSVYETMMGFLLQVAAGRSIALKPKKAHGAPVAVNLDALLAVKGSDRAKWLKEQADQELTGAAATLLKEAQTTDDLLAAVEKKIDRRATPQPVPVGAMLLQPSDERRRSGSHYTPRSLTGPIVRTTLKPILEQLANEGRQPSGRVSGTALAAGVSHGKIDSTAPVASAIPLKADAPSSPTPEQILALKICDPAMGSAAFLVETCRQLGDVLVEAWHVHNCVPKLPPDEDEVLHARRLIAQRCLYGVDKNPLAVDLGKLSLWLATLAKDHPFTFLDHSLRCGDSLVGLSREQIAAFHWQPPAKRSKDDVWFGDPIAERMRTVTEYRQRILAARDDKPYEQLRQELDVADEALSLARLTGDCVIAAYFSAGKDRERVAKLDTLARQLVQYLGPQRRIEDRQPLTEAVASLHGGDHPLQPFHWQIEFPEVFTVDAKGKPTGGFDAIVGNPPFAGKNTLINGNREGYLDWLKALHEESHGNADLVAQFFRRAFTLLRPEGCFGLIATNTIGQGDTRSTGLRWICTHGGTIYAARKRLKWPGQAAVVVSVVNVCRGAMPGAFTLDGHEVPIITAYLFHAGGHEDPQKLSANEGKSFQGSIVLGMGFTFDDTDKSGVANPLSLMHELIAKDSSNAERIFPYIGGEEINGRTDEEPTRWIINFGSMPRCRDTLGTLWASADEVQREVWLRNGVVPEDFPDCVAAEWPDLLRIVEQKVKPQRATDNREVYRRLWWHFAEKRARLYPAIAKQKQVLVRSLTSTNFASFTFLPAGITYDQTLLVFAFDQHAELAILCSRIHEAWALFFGATMKDDPRYNLGDCFETFPFPAGVLEHAAGDSPTTDNGPLTTLETAGREYYEFRAALMVRNNEGLTKTYNRFHDPHETSPDILQLRALHAAMDRAVLEAYAWHDLAQTATCEFLLDYEDDEDEDEGSGARSPGTGRQKKKPWRYRWPDPFRDEVLARLLELNKQRHQEELLVGQASKVAITPAAEGAKKKTTRKKKSAPSSTDQSELDFDEA